MKTKVNLFIINKHIQYTLMNDNELFSSDYYNIEDIDKLINDLDSKLPEDLTLLDKQVNLFIDPLSTIQHDMALPKMFILNVYNAIKKELKDLYPDLHNYKVIKIIKTNKKKYLDIGITLVPKKYAKVIDEIMKKLKLVHKNTYLVKDVYPLLLDNKESHVILHKLNNGYMLNVNYDSLYQSMYLEEYNEITITQSLGVLLAYYKIGKEEFLEMDNLIISDDPLEITTYLLNDSKLKKISLNEFYNACYTQVCKLKGFKL